MTDMTTFNAKRQERTHARVLELLDEIKENPNHSREKILKTLATRWGKSTDTVKHVIQYAKRKKLIKQEKVWRVK